MIECLSDYLVLDLSGTVSGAFAASLMADHGARVYTSKRSIARLASMVPGNARESWTHSLSRNKLLFDDDDLEAYAQLYKKCHVVFAEGPCTNFTPPLNFDPSSEDASRSKVRVFFMPSGADHPDLWSGSLSEASVYATAGIAALTGESGEEPVLPEAPIGESLTGAMAALCAASELWRRSDSGECVDIELASHETLQRMVEWQIPVASLTGRPELRCGNSFPLNAGISNTHLTKDGRYIAVSAANQGVAFRLLNMVGGSRLAEDPKYASESARRENMDELYQVIDLWMARHDAAEVLAMADDADVVAGLIHDCHSICQHEQVVARENLVQSAAGMLRVSPVPRISIVADMGAECQ